MYQAESSLDVLNRVQASLDSILASLNRICPNTQIAKEISNNIIYPENGTSFLVQQTPQQSCTVNITKTTAVQCSGHYLFSSLKHLSIIKYHHGQIQRQQPIVLALNPKTIVPEYPNNSYHNGYVMGRQDYGSNSTNILIHGILSGPCDQAHFLHQINCIHIMVKKICNISKNFSIPNIINYAVTRYTVYVFSDILYIFNIVSHTISHNSCFTYRDEVQQLHVLKINDSPKQHNFDLVETIPFKNLSFCKFDDGFHFIYKNNPFSVYGWSNKSSSQSSRSSDLKSTESEFHVFEFETINYSFLWHEKFSYSLNTKMEHESEQKHFDELFINNTLDGRMKKKDFLILDYWWRIEHYFYFDLNVANDINRREMYILHFVVRGLCECEIVYVDLYLLDKKTQRFIECVKNIDIPFKSLDSSSFKKIRNARFIQKRHCVCLWVKGHGVITFKIQ
eukprot:445535_1